MRRGVSWIGEVGVSGGSLNSGRLMAMRVAEDGFTPGGDIEASVMQCGSGVDGVAVSNTTKRRHDLLPADYNLPAREVAVLLEQEGYIGATIIREDRVAYEEI